MGWEIEGRGGDTRRLRVWGREGLSYLMEGLEDIELLSHEEDSLAPSAINHPCPLLFPRSARSAPPARVHFTFVYIFVAWGCWLTVEYYKEYIALRQTYMVSATEVAGRRRRVLLAHRQAAATSRRSRSR